MNEPKITQLTRIMAKLRDPDGGCPWDVEQTFATIAPYTIEEAYEVADAIDHGDMAALKDELGDLLLQVVFHARMAEEAGAFAFDDVVEAICDKMIRRHPHVFGDVNVGSAEAQTVAWEEQKARERAEKHAETGTAETHSALDGVAKGLPALLRAYKLQRRAARVGFDWPDAAGAADKLREELAELEEEIAHHADGNGNAAHLEDEIGDVLFSAVNVARKLEIDPETALRLCNVKFDRRFRRVEALMAETGKSVEDASLDEMEELWQQVKREELGG